MEGAADDDHRMRSHDVNNRVAAKFRQIVHADDRIVVTAPDIVHARFERDKIVDVQLIVRRPVHATDDATERESSRSVAAGQLFEYLQHPIRIETAVLKVGFGVDPKLELARAAGRPSTSIPAAVSRCRWSWR